MRVVPRPGCQDLDDRRRGLRGTAARLPLLGEPVSDFHQEICRDRVVLELENVPLASAKAPLRG